MRDFSWKYFSMTGDVDAYLLYKEAVGNPEDEMTEAAEEQVVAEEQQEI